MNCTEFDADEIKRLGKRFKKLVKRIIIIIIILLPIVINIIILITLKIIIITIIDHSGQDLDGSGSLSIEEFMSLPELQQNPLVR